MVSLAKELEDEPFHLIASYNQQGDAKKAKHEIFQNGLAPLSPNVTVSLQGGHPGVKGTGYVPYYLVFDQHGDLAYHHQGGPYHGGDGVAVLDRVREMLQDVHVVYVGKQPFERFDKLARQLQAGKGLRKSFKELTEALTESPKDQELVRLVAGVKQYQVRLAAKAEQLLATDPEGARKMLKTAVKDFADTPWNKLVEDLSTNLHDPDKFKLHKDAAKALKKVVAKINKLGRVAGNSGTVLNPVDPKFQTTNGRALEGIKQDLRSISNQYSSLPAGKRAAETLLILE